MVSFFWHFDWVGDYAQLNYEWAQSGEIYFDDVHCEDYVSDDDDDSMDDLQPHESFTIQEMYHNV